AAFVISDSILSLDYFSFFLLYACDKLFMFTTNINTVGFVVVGFLHALHAAKFGVSHIGSELYIKDCHLPGGILLLLSSLGDRREDKSKRHMHEITNIWSHLLDWW
ncbi:hypothetical protein ACJX0J_034265, partial [Zea mays]